MSVNIFSKSEWNQLYSEQGYITVPMLDKDDLVALKMIYSKYDQNQEGDFYCSNWITEAELRKTENAAIQNIIAAKITRIFNGYKALYGCFITKRFSFSNQVHPHVDWQFVQEPDYVAFNIWTPLKRTSKFNGAMWVVPGSHHYYNERRGPNIESKIPSDLLVQKRDIILNAGEALIYDTRLIHGSYPNKFPSKRIALATIMVPEQAVPVYTYKDVDTGNISTYEVDDRFYIEDCSFKRGEKGWELSKLSSSHYTKI